MCILEENGTLPYPELKLKLFQATNGFTNMSAFYIDIS